MQCFGFEFAGHSGRRIFSSPSGAAGGWAMSQKHCKVYIFWYHHGRSPYSLRVLVQLGFIYWSVHGIHHMTLMSSLHLACILEDACYRPCLTALGLPVAGVLRAG